MTDDNVVLRARKPSLPVTGLISSANLYNIPPLSLLASLPSLETDNDNTT